VTVRDFDVAALRAVAEQLAAEAAQFVRVRRREVFGVGRTDPDDAAVRSKSTRTDPVTVVDTETERLLRERLACLRPGESVLGEEGGGWKQVTSELGNERSGIARVGMSTFLVGESLMRQADVAAATRALLARGDALTAAGSR